MHVCSFDRSVLQYCYFNYDMFGLFCCYLFQKIWWQHVWPYLQMEIDMGEVLGAVLVPVMYMVKNSSMDEYEIHMVPTLKLVHIYLQIKKKMQFSSQRSPFPFKIYSELLSRYFFNCLLCSSCDQLLRAFKWKILLDNISPIKWLSNWKTISLYF